MKKNSLFFIVILVLITTNCNLLSPTSPPTGTSVPPTAQPTTPSQPTKAPGSDITQTIKSGSGELVIQRTAQLPASNGVVFTEAQATIPFTISYNKAKGIFDVKGTGRGSGKVELRSPSCHVMSSYLLDYTVEGVLAPDQGLAGDDGNGCYLIIQLLEGWQDLVEAAGQCQGQSARSLVEMGYSVPFGPYKLPLIEGATTRGDAGQPWELAVFGYTVKVQKLDIPIVETGCMVGSIIK